MPTVTVTPHDLPFDEAIAHFQAKGMTISPNSWRDVWQQANARAFTVARVTAMDVLTDIRGEAQKALDAGISLGEFKKNLIPTLMKKGWLVPKGEMPEIEMPDGTIRKRLTPWRLETIYRTNLQTAYSVGRYQQMTEVAESRPYWQYRAVMDSRTRPRHAAMNGRVYDSRHPIWNSWYPPNGFNCRCYVKSLGTRDVEERGLKVSTKGVDERPDEGWRYHVGKAGMNGGWQPDLSRYPDKQIEPALPEKMPFAAAKTIKEAEEWAKQNWANEVLYDRGRFKRGSELSRKKALEKLNAVNAEMASFRDRYPRFALPKIGSARILNDKRGWATMTRAGNANISFANEWGDEVWEATKKWERETGRLWDFVQEESHTAHNVRHEVAHIVDGHYGVQSDPEWQQIRRAWLKRKWAAENISDYSATNEKEFFAELFAQYTSPLYEEHRSFPKEITDFLDKILEGGGRFGGN